MEIVSLAAHICICTCQQTRVYPYPLGAGSARPNPKMGARDPENPLFLGFAVLRGGLRPWSQTMVSEGARPWGGGRSGDCELDKLLTVIILDTAVPQRNRLTKTVPNLQAATRPLRSLALQMLTHEGGEKSGKIALIPGSILFKTQTLPKKSRNRFRLGHFVR